MGWDQIPQIPQGKKGRKDMDIEKSMGFFFFRVVKCPLLALLRLEH